MGSSDYMKASPVLPRDDGDLDRTAAQGHRGLLFAQDVVAMHVRTRKHGLSLQGLTTEAFSDVLNKYEKAIWKIITFNTI